MFVGQAIKGRIFGFWIESVVGLFVDHLIVLFWNLKKRIGLLVCVRKSSEQAVYTTPMTSALLSRANQLVVYKAG